MKFRIERSLKDKVFMTNIMFSDYGDSSLTSEEEKALIEDFGSVSIEVGGTYTGKFKVGESNKLEMVEGPDGEADDITFVQNNMKLALNDTFKISYNSDANKQEATTHLNAYQISEAKCLLFEKEIEKKIAAALKDLKAKQTSFETEDLKEFMY